MTTTGRATTRRTWEGNEEIGPLLKRLRGNLSLRDVNRSTGISSSYLSQIERGERMPGRNMVGKLAAVYNVDPDELMKRAGHTGQPDPNSNEVLEVERAYRYVLADPQFRVGTSPTAPSPSAPSGSSSRCTSDSRARGCWNERGRGKTSAAGCWTTTLPNTPWTRSGWPPASCATSACRAAQRCRS